MTMPIGQTKEREDAATSRKFSDTVEIKTGKNVHRIIAGPWLKRSVYWPTLVPNEAGIPEQKIRSVIVPEKSEFIDMLENTEVQFRLSMGESNPSSQFSPSSKWLYLVFDREDVVPTVRVAAYPWTVFDELTKKQREESTVKKGFLKNGLIFMYDVIITKTVKNPNNPRFTTKYDVSVDSEKNTMEGKVDARLLDLDQEQLISFLEKNNVFNKVFTNEEIEAIKSCDIDLESEILPLSEADIINSFRKNPVYLLAKEPKTDKFYFPQNEKFITFLKNSKVPILLNENEVKQLESGEELENADEITLSDNDNEIKLDDAAEVKSEDNDEIVLDEKPKKNPKKASSVTTTKGDEIKRSEVWDI